MKHKPWFDVLLAARRLNERGVPVTSVALGQEAGLETRIASAWLFKLEKWNYVIRSGKEKTGKRWSWAWTVTRWGMRYKAKIRGKAKLRIAANPSGKQG